MTEITVESTGRSINIFSVMGSPVISILYRSDASGCSSRFDRRSIGNGRCRLANDRITPLQPICHHKILTRRGPAGCVISALVTLSPSTR